MKRFRFGLQAVHTVRKRQEQLALEDYGAAMVAREQARARLENTCRMCEAAWEISRMRVTTGALAAELAHAQEYGHLLVELRKTCETAVHEAQQVVDEKWKALMEARRRREAVDQYHRRQRERYDRAWRYEEQKEMDEIAQRRSGRAMAGVTNAGEEWR